MQFVNQNNGFEREVCCKEESWLPFAGLLLMTLVCDKCCLFLHVIKVLETVKQRCLSWLSSCQCVHVDVKPEIVSMRGGDWTNYVLIWIGDVSCRNPSSDFCVTQCLPPSPSRHQNYSHHLLGAWHLFLFKPCKLAWTDNKFVKISGFFNSDCWNLKN